MLWPHEFRYGLVKHQVVSWVLLVFSQVSEVDFIIWGLRMKIASLVSCYQGIIFSMAVSW
jgi:hypothetical protein